MSTLEGAACVGLWAIFDAAHSGYDEARAKEICRTCPAIDACRDLFDSAEGDTLGSICDMVCAGETARERWVRRTGRQWPRYARTSERIREMPDDPWVNLRVKAMMQ